MNIEYMDVYKNFNFGFKIVVGVFLCFLIFYAFMLILKIRVLKDTVDIAENSVAKLVITANLLISAGGAILAFILILL